MEQIAINQATDILGVIDVQPTFMPGGELPVADGAAVVPVINLLLSATFHQAFATQDWHPPGHMSFASSHPGHAPFEEIDLPYGRQVLWPDHAIQNSSHAMLHADLDQGRIAAIIRKGMHPSLDSYSAFFENDHLTVTGLDGWLRARRVRRIFLAGLATDFCVAWTAADAARLGYAVVIVEDACRAIDIIQPEGETTLAATRIRLSAAGIRFVRSDSLV